MCPFLEVYMYKRIMLKLSGEALGNSTDNIDPAKIADLSRQIKEVWDLGVQIGIVVGGGNYIRGKFADKLQLDRIKADQMGMLATVMNAIALQNGLENAGAKAVVLSALNIDKIAESAGAQKALRYLEDGYIVVYGAGTGNPYCSTDTATSLRACEIKADVIMIAKNGVDGVYSADPNKDPTAKKYDILTYKEMLEKNLQVIDISATSMLSESGIESFVFDMGAKDNIKKAVLQEAIGTKIVKE